MSTGGAVKGALDKENGWHLTEEGLALAAGQMGKALDLDLKEYGSPCIPEDVNRGKLETLCSSTSETGDLVLQVTKIRNVAAPKVHEESGAAPRMLKISMTDGHVTCHGLETSRLDGISVNTPPGTKVRVAGGGRIAVTNGTLMLETGCLKVLGGKVEGITDKWEVQRKLMNFTRRSTHSGGKLDQSGDSSGGGPPPWIPFGRKLNMGSAGGSHEKGMGGKDATPEKDELDAEKDKDKTNANEDFKLQRDDAIKEASKEGSKKVFGGGNKDSIKDAANSTSTSKDTKESIKGNKIANDSSNNDDKRTKTPYIRGGGQSDGATEENLREDKETRRGGRRGRGRGRDRPGKGDRTVHENTEHPNEVGQPSSVSLFDFMEEKFPDKADSKGTEKTKGRQDRPNKQDQGGEEKKRERDQRDRGNPTREEQQKSKGGSRGRNNDGEPGKQQTGRSGKLDPVFVHSSGTVSEGGKVDRGGVKRGSDKGVYKGGSREDKFEDTKSRPDRGGNKEYEPPPRRQKGKNQDTPDRRDNVKVSGKEQTDRQYDRDRGGAGRRGGGGGERRDNYQGHQSDNYSSHNFRDQYSDKNERGNKNQSHRGGNSHNDNRSGSNMNSQQSENDGRQISSDYKKDSRDRGGGHEYSRGVGRGGGRGGKTRGGRENRSGTSDRDFGEWSNATYHDAAQRLGGGNANSQQSSIAQQQYPPTSVQQQQMAQQPYTNPSSSTNKSNQPFQGSSQNHNQYNGPYQQMSNSMASMNLNDKKGQYPQHQGGGYQQHQRQNNGYYPTQQQVDLHQQPNGETSKYAIPPQPSAQGWMTEGYAQQQPSASSMMHQNSQQQIPSLPSQTDYSKQQRQQHYQEQHQPKQSPHQASTHHQQWKVGDECLAKYWEDNQFYPVRVTSVHPSAPTAVVLFKEYGNHEEVLLDDMLSYSAVNSSNGSSVALTSIGPGSSKASVSGGHHPMPQQQPSGASRGFIPTTPGLPPAFPQ